ncbi:hypothetical protein, partial [Vibrio parahaemolyticus]|uniref:hypothetical protein n=1 Tax=Vibrio parahaemolyticus TaxID=670 RepID=UPI001C60B855
CVGGVLTPAIFILTPFKLFLKCFTESVLLTDIGSQFLIMVSVNRMGEHSDNGQLTAQDFSRFSYLKQ